MAQGRSLNHSKRLQKNDELIATLTNKIVEYEFKIKMQIK